MSNNGQFPSQSGMGKKGHFQFENTSGNWTFDIPLNKQGLFFTEGGVILQNIKHAGFNFAKDIRIASIWVFDQLGYAERLILGEDQFTIENPFVADAKKDIWQHINTAFPYYPEIAGIHVGYKSKANASSKFFGLNDEPIYFEQKIMFSDYGTSPAHEPAGVLEAARIFPLLSFNTENKKVSSIRVDYRVHYSLDMFLGADINSELTKILGRGPKKDELRDILKRPNQAGVFRDNEPLPGIIETTGGFNVKIENLFYAGEKPLKYEIATEGLVSGYPGEIINRQIIPKEYTPSSPNDVQIFDIDPTTWDNVHWWSGFDWSSRKYSDSPRFDPTILGPGYKVLPTTPGAFHAAHLHWRWGYISGEPDLLDKTQIGIGNLFGNHIFKVGPIGNEQFKGLENFPNVGGPLLDYRIPNQTIRLGIRKASSKSERGINHFSEKDFVGMFVRNNAIPENIEEGTDLVLWLSFDISRDPIEKVREVGVPNHGPTQVDDHFEGTVFINGIYFAHGPEQSIYPAANTLGKSLPKNRSLIKQIWDRHSNDEKDT